MSALCFVSGLPLIESKKVWGGLLLGWFVVWGGMALFAPHHLDEAVGGPKAAGFLAVLFFAAALHYLGLIRIPWRGRSGEQRYLTVDLWPGLDKVRIRQRTVIGGCLGILLVGLAMFVADFWDNAAIGDATRKVSTGIVGGLIVLAWWALWTPVARIVERRNNEWLRALFWVPWIALTTALCIACFVLFMPQLSSDAGIALGGSFGMLLAAPVVLASSWPVATSGPNKWPEATPEPRPPILRRPSSGPSQR